MAKGSLFVGSGSGKVGNLVLANTKQGQVTRAYQPNVTNPKSKAQMLQRARFACAVKFFKQATENFFKFAYEDKTKVESDYNAFMRHNIMAALPMSREQYLNPSVPALGNLFMMSQGRLANPIQLTWAVAGSTEGISHSENASLFIPNSGTANTIGQLSAILVRAGLQEGDIITIVDISTPFNLATLQDDTAFDDSPEPPKWTILQFVVDSKSEVTLKNIPAVGYFATNGVAELVVGSEGNHFNLPFKDGNTVFASVVVTRKMSDGLFASNSYLEAGKEGKAMIDYLAQESTIAAALNSWGSKGTAILKGSIASK